MTILEVCRQAGAEVDIFDCMIPEGHFYQKWFKVSGIVYKKYGFYNVEKTKIERPGIFSASRAPYFLWGLPYEAIEIYLKNYTPPDLVCINSTITYHYRGAYKIIKILKKIWPAVPIAYGGIFPTLCNEHAHAHSGADYICKGEGEQWIIDLCRKTLNFDMEQIPLDNYDDHPFPNLEIYAKNSNRLHSAPLITSRGCPQNCPNCASSLTANFRRRSPELIVKEIVKLYESGQRNIIFYDDALLMNGENYFDRYMGQIQNRFKKLFFHVPNGIHCRLITPERAKIMYNCNVRKIRLALEQVDPVRMAEQGKLTVDDFFNSVKYLLEAGLKRYQVNAYILIAQPGQTVEGMVDSLAYVLRAGISAIPLTYSLIPKTRDFYNYHNLVKTSSNARQDGTFDWATYEPLTANREYMDWIPDTVTKSNIKTIVRLSSIFRNLYTNGLNLYDGTPIMNRFMFTLLNIHQNAGGLKPGGNR